MTDTPYDIVLFGATSFVGRITAAYLARRWGHPGRTDGARHPGGSAGLRWAIAGRSAERLSGLRADLGDTAADLPLIVADAADPASLQALCGRTRVVVSTVGPYALHGEPLVQACASSGTDYCDLTGEVQWMRRMITRHEATAARTGARLVHCCGFDSIPSDMGMWFAQREAQRRFGQPLQRVKMRVRGARGGFSGGTIASLLNLSRESTRDPALRRLLADPFALCPPGHPFTVRQPAVDAAQFDDDFDGWTAPFVMAPVNTRVVHRSNALSGAAYGADLRYDEAVMTGRGLRGRSAAVGLSLGLGGFLLATAFAPTRGLLRRILPAPGEGPDEETRAQGFFDLRFFGETADGDTLRARVTGDADPGYGSTAKMLGEAAASLAMDVPATHPGGFWTPATLLGEALLARLQQHAGLTFEILDR